MKVWGQPGWGSALAEAFLTLSGIAFARELVDPSKKDAQRERLQKLNPLAQVPTLELPNGEIFTESLAIAHYLGEAYPDSHLIPKDPMKKIKFLRWSTFLVTAIYPTFTYGDEPQKWVPDEKAAAQLKESTDEHRKKLWLEFEKHAEGPYFLGDDFSCIDIYIYVMSFWRPRQDWFKENTPKLFAIREKVAKIPKLHDVWKYNSSP